MFRHRLHEHVGLTVHFNWFLMSFLAGAVNAGGFMACQRFVSHITGFATLAGVDVALGKWSDAVAALSIPIYFLAGVLIAGSLSEGRMARGKRPLYPVIMGIMTLSLGLVTVGGVLGWFGAFGAEVSYTDDYMLLALLCGSSGLQNASISSASGGTLRTTHLTGTTTDLGLGLVRGYFMKSSEEHRRKELAINLRRITILASFILGGAISAILYLRFGYAAFLLPTLIGLYLTKASYQELSSSPT